MRARAEGQWQDRGPGLGGGLALVHARTLLGSNAGLGAAGRPAPNLGGLMSPPAETCMHKPSCNMARRVSASASGALSVARPPHLCIFELPPPTPAAHLRTWKGVSLRRPILGTHYPGGTFADQRPAAAMMNTSNAFAALAKDKKSSKGDSKDGKEKMEKKVSSAQLEQAIFAAPQMSIGNWADEEEDDMGPLPLPAAWGEVRGVVGGRFARLHCSPGRTRPRSCCPRRLPWPMAQAKRRNRRLRSRRSTRRARRWARHPAVPG